MLTPLRRGLSLGVLLVLLGVATPQARANTFVTELYVYWYEGGEPFARQLIDVYAIADRPPRWEYLTTVMTDENGYAAVTAGTYTKYGARIRRDGYEHWIGELEGQFVDGYRTRQHVITIPRGSMPYHGVLNVDASATERGKTTVTLLGRFGYFVLETEEDGRINWTSPIPSGTYAVILERDGYDIGAGSVFIPRNGTGYLRVDMYPAQ